MASQSPQQRVDALAARSQVLRVDAGFGELQFRYWPGPEKAPVLLLVHGGSGSWTHWVKNIVSLQRAYHLWAIDLPGLGESDTLPHGYSAEDAVQAFCAGLPTSSKPQAVPCGCLLLGLRGCSARSAALKRELSKLNVDWACLHWRCFEGRGYEAP